VLPLLKGTYGLAVVSPRNPDVIVGASQGSPLVLGIGAGENFLASDALALMGNSKRVVYLQDRQICILTPNSWHIRDTNRLISQINWDSDKGDFEYYMLKEIYEQPEALENAMRGRLADADSSAHFGGLNIDSQQLRNADRIILTACGSSYHAALVGEYLFEEFARIPVEVEYASEFRYRNPPIDRKTIVIAITQSGETVDTLAALRESKRKGHPTLAVCNVVGSSIAREADGGVYLLAGPEIGVASTKAFTSQVTVLAMLALYLGRMRHLSSIQGSRMIEELRAMPDYLRKALTCHDTVRRIAERFHHAQNFLYLGWQYNYPVALEGALKLKEISYIHAEGHPAAEMKHGPIALVDEETPSVFIMPRGAISDKVISNLEEVKVRGGPVIAVAFEGDEEVAERADEVIVVPEVPDFLQPLVSVIPLQLLAYHIALLRGCDVDKPRNLATSVYVEESIGVMSGKTDRLHAGMIDIPKTPSVSKPDLPVRIEISPGGAREEIDRSFSTKLSPRSLQGRFPERVRLGDRVPLQVRIALQAGASRSVMLRPFDVPPEGVDVKLAVYCPGFELCSEAVLTVRVVPDRDSDWAFLELEAQHPGDHTVEVTAYREATFLGSLSLPVKVDSAVRTGPSTERGSDLSIRTPEDGEATLEVRYDRVSRQYRYQLRSRSFGVTNEILSESLLGSPEEAVNKFAGLMNAQARNLTNYTAEEARRWLKGLGTYLWEGLIPRELDDLFWRQRDSITRMTILSAGDPIPWEMLYPFRRDGGADAGFLAEQFPVVPWLYGPPPPPRLGARDPYFVVPVDAPPTAQAEVDALVAALGGGRVRELTPLLDLLDAASFGLLHFACHNTFLPDYLSSSYVTVGGKRFDQTFLGPAYRGRFRSRAPLVFLNACRSDGLAPSYTQMAGWARCFLTAGAGAFVGSLWEVRDDSATGFAKAFYEGLLGGQTLGAAMKAARTAIQDRPGDPTWLAYTLYGDPAAIITKET